MMNSNDRGQEVIFPKGTPFPEALKVISIHNGKKVFEFSLGNNKDMGVFSVGKKSKISILHIAFRIRNNTINICAVE